MTGEGAVAGDGAISGAATGGASEGARQGPFVLWWTPVAERGGVSRHVLDVATHGIPGVRLIVLCPEGPLAADLRARGRAVVTGPVGAADGARTAIRAVRRVLSRLRPDALHTHLAFADIAGAAAVAGLRSGRGQRIRLVSTEHGIAGDPGLYQRSARTAAANAAVHRARLHRTDAVIAVSESTREQILAHWGSGAPITVVRNAVDVPASPPAASGVRDREGAVQGAESVAADARGTVREGGLRVLSLARLAPEKRIDRVLEAFALLHATRPEARFTIAGEGPEEAALRARVRGLGLQDAVTMPGHLGAAAAMAAHDVVVQLSAWENLSYSLLDAVAHGLGVVATDVGGNREIVPARCLVDVDGEADDAHAVARAIAVQGLDLEARPRRAQTAGGVDGMCRQIADVYTEVLT